jgi:hypothetical protein
VPPTTALYLPAHEDHSVTMDGAVAMRELFIDDEVAKCLGVDPKVMAVSNLLRERVVAICNEPVEWDDRIDTDESSIHCRPWQRTGL